jgi:hypothetical protein
VNFRLVAAQEISDRRGDAGDMNVQLVLAATARRIDCHSDLVTWQSTASTFLNEAAGVPCCLPMAKGKLVGVVARCDVLKTLIEPEFVTYA